MSYILDALRKSESQRRLGQPPDLDAAPGLPESRSGPGLRSWQWVTTAISLTVVAVVVGLYGFGPFDWPRSDEPTARVERAAQEPTETASPQTEAGAPDSESASEAVEASEQPEPVERRRRTVVDRRSPSQEPATSVTRPAPARPGAVATPPPVIPEGARERLVTDAQQAQQLIEAESEAASAAETPTEQEATAEAVADPLPEQSSEPSDEDWTPERAEHLEAWELPFAVRQELPELNLSIHVFSAEPSERFVLINGERRQEGESLGGGARLAEISRQGALVDFRDYRFLIKP